MQLRKVGFLALCLMLGACGADPKLSALQSKYMNQSSQLIELDGNTVHYRDEGEGDVIVLIHGTASSLHTWDQWAAHLKSHYRVIRMDLPGFGLTGPDHSDRYRVLDDVAFLNAFLDRLGVGSVHLAGSSLGGRIAWEYSLEHRDRVRSLTLLNALGYPQESWPPPIQLAQWPVFDTLMTHVSPRFMYDVGLKDVYYDSAMVDAALVDRYFELSRVPGNLEAFVKRVKARLDKDAHKITEIRVPTLVLWGEEDRYFPVENARRFQADIPGAELKIFASVGHLPMEEAPAQSVAVLERFLKRTDLPGAH